MEKDKRYYVFYVRITHKGDMVLKKRKHKVMTQKEMKLEQWRLSQDYKVPLNTIAFSYKEYVGIWQIVRILLNENR